MRPFLKWPGGKYRLAQRISTKLASGKRLIEPFTGSAAIFLNTEYQGYLLADSNPDLINLYRRLIDEGEGFIDYCAGFFCPDNNREEVYYRLREEFNHSQEIRLRSALFLYLNRHCYNGLCRYNSRSEFNTPFGRYLKPYFPRREMLHFIAAAANAAFITSGFEETMHQARRGDVVYCDPPYAPLSMTAKFTDYHTGGFNWQQQTQLARLAHELAARGIPVVISNHNTREIRKLYRENGARLHSFQVQRSISCNAENRAKVGELLALFDPA